MDIHRLHLFHVQIGAILTYLGFAIYAKYSLEPLFDKKGGMIEPEDRLPPAMFGSFFIPICMVGICSFCIFLEYLGLTLRTL